MLKSITASYLLFFCLTLTTLSRAQTISVVYEINDPSEFATATYNLLLFDGSHWERKAGSITPDNAITYQGPTGFYYERRIDGPIQLEWFGAKGDYNYVTKSGADDTQAIQKAVNFAATKGHEIRLKAGKKYLTGTIYAYTAMEQDTNIYPGRPGRLKITGGASGIATGTLEPQGSAFVHKNGLSKPLFKCVGTWTLASAGNTGGHLDFQNVNFIGGNQTTDVIFLELTVGQVSLKNLTVQVNNPAGNGITENNTWESTMENILIRGLADGKGGATGIGLNIKTNQSGGQVNMKVYNNVDSYRNGYNIRIGRRTDTTGTLAPLVFIGGQCSRADHHNLWIDGGTYNLVSIGQQFEGSRKNAILIDSDSASDLPRNIRFINPYLTGGGNIEDGPTTNPNDKFAIHIKNGEGVHLDAPLFNNLGKGILFDRGKAQGLVIDRPVVRTLDTAVVATLFIDAYGTDTPAMRHRLIDPLFNQTPVTIVTEAAMTSFARTEAGARITSAGNITTPSINVGGGTLQRARFLFFNNLTATNITNITDGQYLKEVTLTSSNNQTTIASNGNIYLAGSQPFQLTNRSSLTLVWTGTYWQEIARSDFNNVIYLPKTVSANGTTTNSFAHGLGVIPSVYQATPTNSAAGGIAYLTADATNVYVHYSVAPASGSSLTYNVTLKK